MSLNHVILGLLKREPLTGYEMKKIIQSTPFLYWSGNNNQIYKACAELLDEGYVTKEVQHQEDAPSKKIYTITEDGLAELKDWLLSVTDEPILRKQILIKLVLANHLNRNDLESLLAGYADVVKMQAALTERDLDSCYFAEQYSSDNGLLLGLVRENIMSFYSSELEWIEKVKRLIADLPSESAQAPQPLSLKENHKGDLTMDYQVKETDGKRYLRLTSSEPLIQSEQDAYDIVTLSYEHDTDAVLLEGERLADDFVMLRTGLAGAVLQKFGSYRKVAVNIKEEQDFPVRFQEMLSDFSTRKTFRVFTNEEDALDWLLK